MDGVVVVVAATDGVVEVVLPCQYAEQRRLAHTEVAKEDEFDCQIRAAGAIVVSHRTSERVGFSQVSDDRCVPGSSLLLHHRHADGDFFWQDLQESVEVYKCHETGWLATMLFSVWTLSKFFLKKGISELGDNR